ncbi:MAG TPA: hypothetical protein DCZ72_14255 [Armatimonadetes bacterium]|nr:hypothetical protein [Armatimonadota bacterium]
MRGRRYRRWDKSQIRQHQLLLVSVIMLGLTGMPQRYADTRPAQTIAGMFGGVENMMLVHKFFGAALTVCFLWHIVYLLLRWRSRTFRFSTIPRLVDFKDAWHLVQYLIGQRPDHPRFARYSFIEKFDYWAATGGSVLMIGTGLVIWFKATAHAVVGPTGYDVAVHLHSLESVLALVFLLIGHVYHVHVANGIWPLNMVWWSGEMSREQMEELHPNELEVLEAQGADAFAGPDGIVPTQPLPTVDADGAKAAEDE